MIKNKQLFIVGDGAFAQVAYEYFQYDSEYEVVGFAVEKSFLKSDSLFGLPIVPVEELENHYSKSTFFYAALVYNQLNRLRERLYNHVKGLGYKPACYISSKAFVWKNVVLGDHCFIFEDNTVQPFVSIGENTVLWSGNHIGHHSQIGSHCFISSHVVISGFCNIGDYSFLGVNSTVANNITIQPDNWIGPNVLITKDTEPDKIYKTEDVEPSKISSKRFFKVKS